VRTVQGIRTKKAEIQEEQASDTDDRTFRVVYRTGGRTIMTRHASEAAAVRTAADIRKAFPWLAVSVIAGHPGPCPND
jgi:hypothetical protein